MKKIEKMNEAAWVLGIVLCALGVALCTKAGFGLSMIAAPPYILHLKLVQYFPWWSQGTSEYICQGFLLVLMCLLLRRFKLKFLLCFATAVIFGFVLDGWLMLLGGNGAYASLAMRIVSLVIGELITALAIAFYFKTDMPLQIYELLVTQLAEKWKLTTAKMKLFNDLVMLVLSVVLALALMGGFYGVGIGTVVITLVNAPLIRMFSWLLDKVFVFDARFPRLIEKIRV